jgi:hypothetical protein
MTDEKPMVIGSREHYDAIMKHIAPGGFYSAAAQCEAIRHIMARLGPPEPLDGIEAEKLTEREA